MLESFTRVLASASKFVRGLLGHREMRIFMAGPKSSGKTTILYKLKFNEVITCPPTRGFTVETIEYLNTTFTIWDMSLRGDFQSLRTRHLQDTPGLIYVVDSTSLDSIEEARDQLNEPALNDTLLLVYANKQDLSGAVSIEKIADMLGLGELEDRIWHIQATSVITGEGLYEGLAWLGARYRERREHVPKSQ